MKNKYHTFTILSILCYIIRDKCSFGFIHNTRIKSKVQQKTNENSTSSLSSSYQSSTTTDETEPSSTNPSSSRRNVDDRPHEQRVTKPRKARRLNHSFMHLYRHDEARFDDKQIAPSSKSLNCAKTYLMEFGSLRSNAHKDGIGIVDEEMVKQMAKDFPPLLELDVKRHLRPKMRFLKYTLNCQVIKDVNPTKRGQDIIAIRGLESIPPQFFGARLEKVIAPRHAFLISKGLPHGEMLLQNDAKLFKEFLISCRRLKSFCALCNKWKKKYGSTHVDLQYEKITKEEDERIASSGTAHNDDRDSQITPEEVDAFDSLFVRGIMAAARGDMDPQNQHLQHCNITSGQMVYLLVKHGANPFETDVRDISLIHWAAGSGQLSALKELIRLRGDGGVEKAIQIKADRDGATILHWAAAGAKPKEFGCGGHLHICRYLMENCGGPSKEKEAVNTLTKDGNSVLMWAAWSGSIEIVKLMIRHRADTSITNRNGCTVAHWSASAGIVEICEYLHNVVKVDFDVKNKAGNSPLSHAVAYGRAEVVQWLREEVNVEDAGEAHDLALDFVRWEEDNIDRKKVLGLFTNDWNLED